MLIRYVWAVKIASYYLIFIGQIAHTTFFFYSVLTMYLVQAYTRLMLFVIIFSFAKFFFLPIVDTQLLGHVGLAFQVLYLASNTEILVIYIERKIKNKNCYMLS